MSNCRFSPFYHGFLRMDILHVIYQLETLDIRGLNILDDDIASLRNLQYLKKLYISNDYLSITNMEHISQLRNLNVLHLNPVFGIQWGGLRMISSLSLYEFYFKLISEMDDT